VCRSDGDGSNSNREGELRRGCGIQDNPAYTHTVLQLYIFAAGIDKEVIWNCHGSDANFGKVAT
jgi:hypothetical protein